MAQNEKRKFKSFKLHGKVAWWKAVILVAIVVAACYFGALEASHQVALGRIPRVDVFDEHGLLRQETGYSCAPSAMAMFFRDESVDASRYEIAVLSKTRITGTSEKGVRKAARYYGYEMSMKEMDFTGIVDFARPLILLEKHMGIWHVSYIRPYESEKIIQLEILDPLDGRMILTEGAFYEYYGEPASKKNCYIFTRKAND